MNTEDIRKFLDENENIDTYSAAKQLEIPEMEVIMSLDAKQFLEIPKDQFSVIVNEIMDWGRMTTIVSNDDIILEVKDHFPKGSFGHGYYNLHSKDSTIGGHISADNIENIFMVSRPFRGIESYSIQFYNGNKKPVFKQYLGRDAKRQLLPEQKQKFMEMRKRYQT